jgi:hypothetical protein
VTCIEQARLQAIGSNFSLPGYSRDTKKGLHIVRLDTVLGQFLGFLEFSFLGKRRKWL